MKNETEIKSLAELAKAEMQEIVDIKNCDQSPANSIQFLSRERKAEINKEVLQELGMTINPENRIKFALLWAFLCGHNEETKKVVEDNNLPFDFNKGILILGSTGIGKTCLMRWFLELSKRFYKQKIRLSNANDVVADFRQFGDAIIKKHGVGSFTNHAHRPIPNHHEPIHEYFDDLGTEENTVVYGQRTDVFRTILTDRHRMFLEHGLLTFATSNLTIPQILERYGERVESRMKQMFNIWSFSGRDLRKPEAK